MLRLTRSEAMTGSYSGTLRAGSPTIPLRVPQGTLSRFPFQEARPGFLPGRHRTGSSLAQQAQQGPDSKAAAALLPGGA